MPDGFGFGEIADCVWGVVISGEPVGVRTVNFHPFDTVRRALLECGGVRHFGNGGNSANVLVGGESGKHVLAV